MVEMSYARNVRANGRQVRPFTRQTAQIGRPDAFCASLAPYLKPCFSWSGLFLFKTRRIEVAKSVALLLH